MTDDDRKLLKERGFKQDKEAIKNGVEKYVLKKSRFSTVKVTIQEFSKMYIILGEIKINGKKYTYSLTSCNLTFKELFDFQNDWNHYKLKVFYDDAFPKHHCHF